MKYILTERQYKIISEQSNNIDWLVNWFKNVPEKKIKNTFTRKVRLGLETNMAKDEIVKLLSDKSKVVILNDPNEIKRLKLDGKLGLFFTALDTKNPDPRDRQYLGKVVINSDWKNIIKNNPQFKDLKTLETLTHHEQTHLLQKGQRDADSEWDVKGSKLISNFCTGNTKYPECTSILSWFYNGRPDEIYAHLMTIREMLKLQPTDIIVDANATIKNKIVTINVTVKRGGNTMTLPTRTMNFDSSTFQAIYCCSNSFKRTLMYLHNTLAKNDNPNNSELDKTV